jgi:hypothetical protein
VLKGEADDEGFRFISLLSSLCRHYSGWSHDFWRRMGRNEFYAWVDQVYREQQAEAEANDSWAARDQDPWWQQAREKRRRLQGR